MIEKASKQHEQDNKKLEDQVEKLRLQNLELKKQAEDKDEVPVQSSKTCSIF